MKGPGTLGGLAGSTPAYHRPDPTGRGRLAARSPALSWALPRASALVMLVCPLRPQQTSVLSVTASVSPRHGRPKSTRGTPGRSWRQERGWPCALPPDRVGEHRVRGHVSPGPRSGGCPGPPCRAPASTLWFRTLLPATDTRPPWGNGPGVREGPLGGPGRACPPRRRHPHRGLRRGPGARESSQWPELGQGQRENKVRQATAHV